ncbi:hypothetical protein LWI29_001701 [Acer saccharum]|uniref:Gag/pol protein n=1 Tax=Acer saccharum TaxID=4024 RepID=A0AA39SSX9_ACESA|nr:hypothetical protein LWI29_001701 [Acer saccharum]
MLARMKEGTSVREHVLNMMSYFNTAEIIGGAINEPSQVSIILTTLPKSFDQFKSNYGMNKLRFSLTQLLNELSTFESLTKDIKGKTGEANVAEPSSSNNKKRKRSVGKVKGKPKPKKAQSKKKGASIDKSKGKCFHCNKVGHWKRNCPQYLEEVAKKKKTKGKMTKRPFTGKGLRAKEPLELIHSDVCGPMNVKARGGYRYYVTFIDDYSRYGYVYLMQRKSKTFEKFKEFRAEVENQLGKTIKSLRSDRGGCSKETRGGYFYSHEDNKVFVSTNATFLEDNYISDHKPRSKIVLNELEPGETSIQSTRVVDPLTSESQMIPIQDTLPPRRSVRVVR